MKGLKNSNKKNPGSLNFVLQKKRKIKANKQTTSRLVRKNEVNHHDKKVLALWRSRGGGIENGHFLGVFWCVCFARGLVSLTLPFCKEVHFWLRERQEMGP